MSLNDTLTEIFDLGVTQLTIAKNEKGDLFVQAQHPIMCGAPGNLFNVMHQAQCLSLINSIEQIRDNARHAAKLRRTDGPNIVRPGRN